jgi:hypothetical protein
MITQVHVTGACCYRFKHLIVYSNQNHNNHFHAHTHTPMHFDRHFLIGILVFACMRTKSVCAFDDNTQYAATGNTAYSRIYYKKTSFLNINTKTRIMNCIISCAINRPCIVHVALAKNVTQY